MAQSDNNFLWWQKGIIYQVYPRSFFDTNDDGIGDLEGIRLKLDHLKWLGVNTLWLSPIYPSPMADFGYDVSDYTGIHTMFGSMEQFDQLLNEVHSRSMKMILDFVPNHSSDQHPWFLESKSSKDNPKRDWYIWHGGTDTSEVPNNWLSVFGGSAWEWDEQTRQYYYHAFLKEQPDLNWRNPEVQDAMLNAMRFWLDKGVDGFRVDVMWHMIKDDQLRDNPQNPDYREHMATYEQLLPVYSTDQPEVHEIVRKMRSVLDAYKERMMIGEIYLPIQKLVAYYGADLKGAHLPFNFQLLSLPWEARTIAASVDQYEGALPDGGWPNWVLGNHDQPRITSRVGLDQAKNAMILLLTLRGTPTIYYGEEIGMRDVPIPEDEIRDPQGLNMPGKNLSRDPSRTPMQWNGSENAGFSANKPWLRVGADYTRNNVEAQLNNEGSMLNMYKRLVQLRQSEPSLSVGQYKPIYSDQQVISYLRESGGNDSFLIVLNLSHRPCYFKPSTFKFTGKIVYANSPELVDTTVTTSLNLSGDEGVVIRLNKE